MKNRKGLKPSRTSANKQQKLPLRFVVSTLLCLFIPGMKLVGQETAAPETITSIDDKTLSQCGDGRCIAPPSGSGAAPGSQESHALFSMPQGPPRPPGPPLPPRPPMQGPPPPPPPGRMQGPPPPPQQPKLRPSASGETPHLYQPRNQAERGPLQLNQKCAADECNGYTVNFEDISVVQLISFISKISGKNFIYNSNELKGNDGRPLTVTIVSQDATSVANLSAALLQVLKMNNLSMSEQGNNVIISRNQNMSKVSTVITDNNLNEACDTAVITRVFQLTNVDPVKIADIVKTLVSPNANVEPSIETRHLIVTDITANVNKISDLIQAIDTPNLAIDIAEYHVQNADPACLAGYAREILAPLAGDGKLTITPEPSSSSIFIVSTPLVIEKARGILASLDVPDISCIDPAPLIEDLQNNTFFMYRLKYHNGQEIADAIHEVGINLQYTGVSNIDFVNTIFSLQWLPVNNSLVFAGTDESIAKVVDLINELDTLPKQVFLEVLILDTTLTNSLDFGVQWIALGADNNTAFGSGLLGVTPPLQGFANNVASTIPPQTPIPGTAFDSPAPPLPLATPANLLGAFSPLATEAFSLGFVGNVIRHNGQSFLTLGGLLSALDEEGDSTVVLNPRLMVENNQPAAFFVGQNIPYQTTSTVIQQTGSVTQNIQYEDVGVDLQITPTIAPDNMVTLQINQTVAEVDPTFDVGNLTPTTRKSLVTTRIHMPSGTYLVMSGQVRDEITYIRSGIPCLGTLPLIGPAFSRTIERRQKRNLIFFVKPTVISTPEGGVNFTNCEGYRHNWETNPCWILDNPPYVAPECQTFPIPPELEY